jgi:3-hydroxymyristoyl/3-hydroxydecanoyl-(acyl carrier protein) dehydratase
MEATFLVAPDHPALAGHFPGRPIVPGVVILDEVIAAIGAASAGRALAGFANVKFHAPLEPGRRVVISWRGEGPRRVAFSCRSDGRLLAAGVAEFAEQPR